MNFQYKRVSRKRTCLICGKPDWCSFTPDSKISFCARVCKGADRVSRTGWGVFYHEPSLFGNFPIPCPTKPPPKKPELAPIEIRDFAYKKLIELSPATRSRIIIDGAEGLRRRKIFDFDHYGSLPKTQSERNDLAKLIRSCINKEFPEFVKTRKLGLSGIPGFWIDNKGNSRLWIETDSSHPMMLIPYRNESGLIEACQIRVFGNIGSKPIRYLWLSTPEKSSGVGSGSPLHFVSYFPPSDKKTLIITEGALKAATLKFFKPEYDIIANAGVSCSHSQIIKVSKLRPITLAFDIDYSDNFFVTTSLAKLINGFASHSIPSVINQISILTWNPKFKGIDDALINQASLKSFDVLEWFKSLSPDFQTKILISPELSHFQSILK